MGSFSFGGLVLVTGVTGSGKSTTISALVNHINLYRKTRIITLEDPVEFLFKSETSMVSQRQVGQDVSSFSGGLRSALLCSVARLLGLRRDRHRRHRKRGERGGDLADNADAVGHEDSLLVAGAGDGFPPEERIRAIWLNHC